MHHDAMRMTEGSIAKQMLRFAAPLFLGNLFQQLYNTADALIVGNMLGTEALAAVSATGPLVFLIISLFVGISAGSGVLISRYFGAQDQEKLERAVHTNVAFSLVAGLLMTVFGVIFTPTILDWMDTPEPELSAGYIRIFFAGSMGLVLYNGLRGMMQAVGDGKNPLKYLIFCSCLNVVLDVTFIGVFHTGVGGAALATIISQFLSGLLCLRRLGRAAAGRGVWCSGRASSGTERQKAAPTYDSGGRTGILRLARIRGGGASRPDPCRGRSRSRPSAPRFRCSSN